MRKFIAFLRSMKFGVILLILVMACSLAGSLVPQDRALTWYIDNYPGNLGSLIVGLGVHRLFSTWYFVTLISLLGLNLLLCTVIRIRHIGAIRESALMAAASLSNVTKLDSKAAGELSSWFSGKRYKKSEINGIAVFTKNMHGYYGSLIVHFSLLLILIFGGIVLSMSKVTDYTLTPKEILTLDDGTVLILDSFRITDDAGRTEYASIIQVASPSGAQSGQREIKVNHPLTFRSYKYYQFNFGSCGSITATNTETGGWDEFYLTQRSFLSSGSGMGIWFEALFPGYVYDEHGHITPLTMTTPIYPDPVYYVLVSDESGREAKLVFPGEVIQVGDIEFSFNEPAYYSGIRVKRVPHPFLEFLFASFGLMVFGFWLCFFHLPTIVAIGQNSYKTGGLNSGISIDIEAFLENLTHQADA